MLEQTPKPNKPEWVEIADTGIRMPKIEYERYKDLVFNFLNMEPADYQRFSNEELVKLGEVALQMSRSLQKFADGVEQVRGTSKD